MLPRKLLTLGKAHGDNAKTTEKVANIAKMVTDNVEAANRVDKLSGSTVITTKGSPHLTPEDIDNIVRATTSKVRTKQTTKEHPEVTRTVRLARLGTAQYYTSPEPGEGMAMLPIPVDKLNPPFPTGSHLRMTRSKGRED